MTPGLGHNARRRILVVRLALYFDTDEPRDEDDAHECVLYALTQIPAARRHVRISSGLSGLRLRDMTDPTKKASAIAELAANSTFTPEVFTELLDR